jgi:hypothetical protein
MYVLYFETAPWVRMEFRANRTHDCKAQHIRTASHEHDTDDRFKLKATVMNCTFQPSRRKTIMATDTSAESWGQVWRGGVVLVGWCWVGVWCGAERLDCPRHEDPLKTWLDGPRHEDLLETWLVVPRHAPLVNWTRGPRT